MQPFIAVGMIKMPMRVYKMPHGVRAEAIQSFGDPRPRCGDAGIDEQLSIPTCEHRDIPTRTFEEGNVATKFLNGDFGCSRGLPKGDNRAFTFGKQAVRCKPERSHSRTGRG